jgi:hypothetical protein
VKSKLTTKLTEADCRNVTWQVVEVTPTYRRSVGHGTHPVSGVPIEVMKTEFLADEPLQALNAEERNSRDGKRWSSGAGSEKGGNVPMIRAARIPLNKLYAEIVPRMKQGDEDHLKWWLNRDENQPFRTKSGRL